MAERRVAACLKWAATWPEVDPLTGAVRAGEDRCGTSPADEAALEVALALGAAWGAEVIAVAAGPAPADEALRQARACGADAVVRVELDLDSPSETVAAALAEVLGEVDVVCCGDASADRGTGAVPAFLAARLGAAQALGLVALAPVEGAPGRLAALRRLDHGRREHLDLAAPAVVSVEAGVARLRRAPLGDLLASRRSPVAVHRPRPLAPPGVRVEHRGPYRPRARVLPAPDPAAPARERILALVGGGDGSGGAHEPPRVLRAGPAEAAAAILDQLRQWGYR